MHKPRLAIIICTGIFITIVCVTFFSLKLDSARDLSILEEFSWFSREVFSAARRDATLDNRILHTARCSEALLYVHGNDVQKVFASLVQAKKRQSQNPANQHNQNTSAIVNIPQFWTREAIDTVLQTLSLPNEQRATTATATTTTLLQHQIVGNWYVPKVEKVTFEWMSSRLQSKKFMDPSQHACTNSLNKVGRTYMIAFVMEPIHRFVLLYCHLFWLFWSTKTDILILDMQHLYELVDNLTSSSSTSSQFLAREATETYANFASVTHILMQHSSQQNMFQSDESVKIGKFEHFQQTWNTIVATTGNHCLESLFVNEKDRRTTLEWVEYLYGDAKSSLYKDLFLLEAYQALANSYSFYHKIVEYYKQDYLCLDYHVDFAAFKNDVLRLQDTFNQKYGHITKKQEIISQNCKSQKKMLCFKTTKTFY
ncbi:hypothetical protein RFI_21498 [Reticulomyxa filosa]|uniref:Uncharacterized protein n=1 Tax=Reticulomyxa filosa TaxID=46433 RepID=X6MPX7_RETFI|nr:hypothetical protein RFI_21498 [Reticulomyxa filosa]|eukprot:ETO15869.1 hypothetical protein RFI_21498 [Reticulomyxa filosa]